MARTNTVKPAARTRARTGSTPLRTESRPTARTATGGVAFRNDPESELFRLGVNHIGNDKDAYHDRGHGDRDSRHAKLAAQVALDNPTWIANFYPWLRSQGNIRTATLIGTAAAINARLSDSNAVREDEVLSSLGHRGINRFLAAEVPQRADEPTEYASYYMGQYGSLPKALKRGLGDSAQRLWNPYSVMKYDTASHGMRFADLMNVAHFSLEDQQLAQHIMNRRFGNDESLSELPRMVRENIQLRKDAVDDPSVLLNPARLRAAGMTWEDTLSLAGPRVDKGELWNALILAGMVPIFAMVRNLRNFDEAGISQEAKEYVHSKLTDPEVIAKSRMFPFRFLSAAQSVSSYTWLSDLETATQLATQNIPEFEGETIVLVDTSASMDDPFSSKSKMTRSGMAAFFGGAVAAKNAGHVHLFIYASTTKEVPVKKGVAALALANEMHRRTGEVGHGTQTGDAIKYAFSKYPNSKRILINTDMQSFPVNGGGRSTYGFYGHSQGQTLRSLVDPKVHMYAFDLGGYETGDLQSSTYERAHQLGGMTDSTFRWIPLVEMGLDARWPWDN